MTGRQLTCQNLGEGWKKNPFHFKKISGGGGRGVIWLNCSLPVNFESKHEILLPTERTLET